MYFTIKPKHLGILLLLAVALLVVALIGIRVQSRDALATSLEYEPFYERESKDKSNLVSEKTAIEVPEKTAYLTFDDGPSSITPSILDALSQSGVKATFFVTAQREDYLYHIKREHEEGHTVAVHSFTHDFSQVYASPEAFFKDVELTRELIFSYTGTRPIDLRFPGGGSNTVASHYMGSGAMKRLAALCEEKGYRYHDWNVDTRDAVDGALSADTILSTVKKQSKGNDVVVILMHDIASASSGPQAIPLIVDYLRGEGYVFDTVDNLAEPVHHTMK